MVAAVGNGWRSRRLAAVSVLAVALTSACGTGGSGRITELTYVSYGGATQDAMIAAWQEPYRSVESGIRFVNTSPPDMAQVRAQVENGAVGWNLVSTAPWQAIQNCGSIYERLDVPDLDLGQFPPDLHGECFVTDYRYGLIFAYNAVKWPDPATAPQTVQDFFDVQKFPGKRGVVPALADGILEWALIADGVDPASLYPLDVDRALARWETIRADTVWAPNAENLQELVTSAQVDLQLLVQPSALAALDAGAQIVPVWDTTMTSVSGLAIPRGSPYRKEAEAFLSFVLQPAQQARIAELLGVSPINLGAQPTWSENGAKVDAFGEANDGTSVAVDQVWWSQNWTETSTKFNTWRTPPA
jgi:putative spermidine/putrescine transport system substrate-binding protein